jgi:MSHA biogenesis protein MshQ
MTSLGGVTSTGGAAALGGVTSTGGAAALGGANPTGGATALGGVTSTGGATALGGANPTGGATATGGSTATPPPILKDCRLYYRMDELSWSGLAGEVIDSSGAGNHARAVSGATTTASGKLGRAGSFDGVGYLDVGDNPSLRPTTALTVAFWLYLPASVGGTAPGFVTKRNGYADSSAFMIAGWTNDALYVDIDTENDRFASTKPLPIAQWVHIAVVYDGSLATPDRVSVYFNATLDSIHAETSTSITQFASPLEIGRLRNGGDVLNGRLDEVGMWARPLTLAEIQSLYLLTAPW